jgi:hypothetical protein
METFLNEKMIIMKIMKVFAWKVQFSYILRPYSRTVKKEIHNQGVADGLSMPGSRACSDKISPEVLKNFYIGLVGLMIIISLLA